MQTVEETNLLMPDSNLRGYFKNVSLRLVFSLGMVVLYNSQSHGTTFYLNNKCATAKVKNVS